MKTPVPSDHAIERYILKIDASASRHDASNAIRKLYLTGRRIQSDREGIRILSHGVVLVVTQTLTTVMTVYPQPRDGQSPDEELSGNLAADLRKRSRFVVVEGIDGAGKTTLLTNLAEVMPASTLFLRCNRDTEAGLCARTLIAQKQHDYAIQAAMIADKFQLDRQIRAAREEGRTVVLDRWVQSAFAYAPRLRPWLAQAYGQLDVPTHVLWLDVPLGTALKRLAVRGETDALETKERLTVARTWYAQQAVRPDWHTLDGLETEESVVRSALEAIGA